MVNSKAQLPYIGTGRNTVLVERLKNKKDLTFAVCYFDY